MNLNKAIKICSNAVMDSEAADKNHLTLFTVIRLILRPEGNRLRADRAIK